MDGLQIQNRKSQIANLRNSGSPAFVLLRGLSLCYFATGMNPPLVSEKGALLEAFGRRHRTGLVTLLFTDMVGSTALKQQLGDRASALLFEKHHQIIRELLKRFSQGEEVETAGDSFLMIFATPSDAVQFSLLLQSRLRQLKEETGAPVQDRIGIHVGEVVMGADAQSQKPKDLYGIQIDTCASNPIRLRQRCGSNHTTTRMQTGHYLVRHRSRISGWRAAFLWSGSRRQATSRSKPFAADPPTLFPENSIQQTPFRPAWCASPG